MLQHFGTYLIGIALLCSCSEDQPDKLQLYLETENQHYCNDLSNSGWEIKYFYIEMADDITNPEGQNRGKYVLSYMNKIDSLTAADLLEINKMKLDLLKKIGANTKLFTKQINKNDRLHIPVCELYRLHPNNFSASFSSAEQKKLFQLIWSYRNTVCKYMVSSNNFWPEHNYYFDPPVADVENKEQLYRLLDKRFESNNVAPDDQEALKRTFAELTYNRHERIAMNGEKNWTVLYGNLTQVQTKILRARANVFSIISSRMCIAEYNFNQIMPIVNGKDIIRIGSKEHYEIFVAALNSDRQPILETNIGTVIKIEHGIASIEVENLKPGKHLLKGTITILNKSGIPKTLPWQKEIEAVE